MKISELVKTLMDIVAEHGDISITGGYMAEDKPLSGICITDDEGREIWPQNPNGLDLTKVKIDGVFLTS